MLILAAGKIRCVQCTAKSKRTGEQCKAPALRISKTKKCRIHGGKSTGPKTEAGIERIREANKTSGTETKDAREERSRKNLWFAQAEDVMQVLEMTSAKKTRGRKPNCYKKIKSIDDVKNWLFDINLNSVVGESSDC